MVGRIVGAEDEVNTTEKVVAGLGVYGGASLGESAEIVHVDFHLLQEVGGGVGGEAMAEDRKAMFLASQWWKRWWGMVGCQIRY